MLKRFDNWPELLAAYLAQHQHTPFAWGRFDCALFAADAVHVMTGVDTTEIFRFQYSTALGAAKKMKRVAGGGLEQVAEKICAQHELPEIPVATAQRGDAVFLELAEVHSLGIVGLHGTEAVFAGPDGLKALPISACKRAWRIG